MPTSVSINEFLKLSETHPMLDVRTPDEFNQGHIPGAINLPIFTNEERIIIGTLYKQQGRQPAVLKGLDIVGPKLTEFIKQAIVLNKTETFMVHCWRGGMRSSSMAWFLELYGFKCITLKGGYKTYRQFVLNSFNKEKNIIVLGGKTGTGKTMVLNELHKLGEQTIDLEKLAHHKGSAFGALGEIPQLSQEQFENELSNQLLKFDCEKKIWLENESRKIGRNILPLGLWNQMRNAMVVSIILPKDERLNYLVGEYGKFSKEELIEATKRISKRIGGLKTIVAIEAIEEGNYFVAFEICLDYYDKTYAYGEEQREKAKIINCVFEKLNPETIAKEVFNKSKEFNLHTKK